jgi:hypothetical protein
MGPQARHRGFVGSCRVRRACATARHASMAATGDSDETPTPTPTLRHIGCLTSRI